MAKQPKETKPSEPTSTPTPTAPTNTPPQEPEMTTAAKPAEGSSTAMVPAASATVAPASTGDSSVARNKALADRLPPQYRDDVLFMVRPTSEQLLDLVGALPGDKQAAMMELIRKTRPKKQGAHTANEGFSPTMLKVNQGTGNDPAKPAKHPPGNFYTADSRDMDDTIEGAVLGFYEGRTMWPAKDQGGEASKAPLCSSLDRKMGSRYGACGSCPNATRAYNDGGCGRDVTVFLIDRAMTGIYELKFAKTSVGGGEAMIRVMKNCDTIWQRWFVFKNEVRTEGDRRWYVTSAKPFTDGKDTNATNTDPLLHPLFEGLSRLMDADVFFPALASVYDRSKSSSDAGGEVASGVDEAKLLGNSATGTPDYSKDDNPNV